MKACFQIPECSLSYTKIMQSECNSKLGKHSFTRLDIAEPQLILYKGTDYFFQNIFFNVKILSFSHNALSATVDGCTYAYFQVFLCTPESKKY